MTDKPVELDQHRGIAAQKATELRRLLAEVAANERASLAAPAANWEEAADKVRYLLSVLAATPSGQDPRKKSLIQAVLHDFSRLSR
jgi:hypothetical protein